MAKSFSLKNSKMAGRIQDIQKRSVEQGVTALNIPLNEIDSNPDNERIFSIENIGALAEEIDKNGFQGAITVFRKEDGRYEISSGHRRFLAMKMLEKETIPCIVMPMPDDEAKKADILLSSNFETRVLKPMDFAKGIQYYENLHRRKRDFKGQIASFVAKSFHISESEYYRYKELNNLVPELQEAVNTGRVSYSAFREKACKDLTEEQQKELAAHIFIKLEASDDSLSRKDIVGMAGAILGVVEPESKNEKTFAEKNDQDTLDTAEPNKGKFGSDKDLKKKSKKKKSGSPSNPEACSDPDAFLINTISGIRDIMDYEINFKSGNEVIGDMLEELEKLIGALRSSRSL